jgi:hypothetical protein
LALDFQRAAVEVEQLVLLLAVGLFHFPQLDHLAHDLGVEAVALGFGVDLADIGAEIGLFGFQPLDALRSFAAAMPPVSPPSAMLELRPKGTLEPRI